MNRGLRREVGTVFSLLILHLARSLAVPPEQVATYVQADEAETPDHPSRTVTA